jgi:hypothetical protein
MRALIATAIAALAIAAPAGAYPAAASSTTCRHDTPAVIGGEHKCLGPGEYCAPRYERQYERYGFECSRQYDPPRLRRR